MNGTASIAARFSASAATYNGSALIQKAVADRVAGMLADFSKSRLVLEVGCGTGLLTERLLDVLPEAQIHALDISEGMIKQAQSRMGNVERVRWILADARCFAGDAVYDLAVSSSSLHWIVPIEDTFRALSRHLVEGGHLVFGLMQAGTLAELHASRRRVLADKPARSTLPTETEVMAALAQTGFRVLRRERSVRQIEYPSAEQLLKVMHDQGVTGGNVSHGERALNRGELKRLVADYDSHHRKAGKGVIATYDVLYVAAQKPGKS